jgi:DNA-binding GntR family transcriptional regulator
MARERGEGSRSNQVYEALVGMIRAGKLRSGERVREEGIAAALNVSRTPVREAFARLQSRGLLESSPSGLAVAGLTRPQVMELYAIRARLEGDAAAFAAENASAAELAALRHTESLFNAQRGEAQDFARANAFFHQALYEAAHNRYLLRMLADLNDSLALIPDTTFSVPGRARAAKAEHRAILAAILDGDAATAERCARDHIMQALHARLRLLFSLPVR